jgi:hypothetical protein
MPTVDERWEQGIEHDPRSVAIFEGIRKIDFEECQDYFCWKAGGDGDNGEELMYQLDVYFERLREASPEAPAALNPQICLKCGGSNCICTGIIMPMNAAPAAPKEK